MLRLRGGRSSADSARGTRPSGLPFSACAAGGLPQTAPEGHVPLDSLSPLRRGMGALTVVYSHCFVPPKGRRDEGVSTANFPEREYNYCTFGMLSRLLTGAAGARPAEPDLPVQALPVQTESECCSLYRPSSLLQRRCRGWWTLHPECFQS